MTALQRGFGATGTPRTFFLAGLMPALTGCLAATTSAPYLFGGRLMEAQTHAALGQTAGAQDVAVEGALVTERGSRSLELTFTNHGAQPIRFNYITDEYVARAFDGRSMLLEKDHFWAHPTELPPGDDAVVRLKLPISVAAKDITQLIARLEEGKRIVILASARPLLAEARAQEPLPGGTVVPAAPLMAPSVSTIQTPALLPPEPRTVPVGTVPVVVEFYQELGVSLKADVQWDGVGETVHLAPGDRRLFYVMPGPHRLHVTSELPAVRTTQGHVPLVVGLGQSLQVDLRAEAKLQGVELRVHVRHEDAVLANYLFQPGS